MLDSHHDDGKRCCFFELYFDVTNRVGKGRGAVRQEFLHSVIGNYDHTDVDLCLLKAVSQMDDIAN